MRIDVVTIFPDYLAPLGLSLPGKAQASGLLDVRVHDLRQWTHDRHHTTDDTPYGGGAGMVMKPEPWGEALDALDSGPGSETVSIPRPVLVVPTPSGEPFTQTVARELSTAPRLIFACGRYEGIDQRVFDEARTRMPVRELSLGDYVLNGGEVAALAMIEAIVRLIPGFMGNPDSLVEESHSSPTDAPGAAVSAGTLLEYPVYTKPATWRGHPVPEVLLGGHHARIQEWRHEQSRIRTARRRPDLLDASQVGEVVLARGVAADLAELFTLQRACWVQEQEVNPGVEIPALLETMDQTAAWLASDTVITARRSGRLVGAVRAGRDDRQWDIGRLMVAPDQQGQGLGRRLLAEIEAAAPPEVSEFVLFTGAGSTRNQAMYRKAGYRLRGQIAPGVVRLTKRARG